MRIRTNTSTNEISSSDYGTSPIDERLIYANLHMVEVGRFFLIVFFLLAANRFLDDFNGCLRVDDHFLVHHP